MNKSGQKLGTRVPKLPRYLNTGMALVLYGFSIYHFTQPNAAWRSGTIESITATCLLAAAYLVPVLVAIIINAFFAFWLIVLGIRHVSIGGGWVSGSTELLFAALLVTGAFMIHKQKKSGRPDSIQH
jgi:hypothetical protein